MKKLFVALVLGLFVSQSAFSAELKVKSGSMNFLMDAPLEKIQGATTSVTGSASFSGDDLKTIKGTFIVDLSKLATHTFQEDEKNKTQTEHMHNWFEIGNEVSQDVRKKNMNATLVVNGATSVTKKSDTESVIALEGQMNVHGITKKIPIELSVKKNGNIYEVATVKPFMVSLIEHDIKPRDLAGKLLEKTLAALGEKVATQAQVSVKVSLE